MNETGLFTHFFNSGLEESASPFLTTSSRRWGHNLSLKAALTSALCLGASFTLSFFPSATAISGYLLVLVYFLAGIPKLILAIDDLIGFNINIDVLMTLAAFLSVLIGGALEGGLLLVLFALSGAFEETVTGKAKNALQGLTSLAPTTAQVLREDGQLRTRHVGDIVPGDHILVRSGGLVPLDGRVVDGCSSVDLSHLTGESLPARKEIGDEVPAGATSLEGALTLEVLRTSSDSTIARIVDLVTRAHEARPRFQRWLDRVSRGYALSVIFVAFFLTLFLPLVGALPFFGVDGSVYRGLTFLIAASPCAVIIALPVAYLSAISACARQGILLKGGVTLDALASCSILALDKTGTLTQGEPHFLGIEPLPSSQPDETAQALAVAAALEQRSLHPIAKAILRAHEGPCPAVSDFRSIPGYGVEGTVKGIDKPVYVGHPSYIENELDSSVQEELKARIDQVQALGHSIAVVRLNKQLYLLCFDDPPRPGIRAMLDELKQRLKLKLIMLTGDHRTSADQVANAVGIDQVHAGLKPEDKLDHIARLANEYQLAMIGDGINDAPSLARATVGISLGEVGTSMAVQASDIVLLHDNLGRLPWLWTKARKTTHVVRQNISIAVLALLGGSLAALLGLIPLWLAVTLHEGGTVLVALNSLRLLRTKIR